MEISPLRCVLDTNVVIDFDTGGCLDALFALPLVLTVPDIIIADEYLSVDAEHLKALGLQVDSLTGPQVMDIIALGQQYVRPSRYDLAAYVLARDLSAILLTGDGSLRTLAKTTGVDCHGTLWLLDHIVSGGIAPAPQMAAALQRMLDSGSRLPKAACDQRLKRWQRSSQ